MAPTVTSYKFDQSTKLQCQGMLLLNKVINNFGVVGFALSDVPVASATFKAAFHKLVETKLLTESDQRPGRYVGTEKGRQVLKRFLDKQTSCVQMLSLYEKVDLQTGDFYFHKRTSANRWSDLRIAVATFKSMPVLEVGFMLAAHAKRADLVKAQWHQHIEQLCAEAESLCNRAVTAKQLGLKDDLGFVSGTTTLKNIIKKGARLQCDMSNMFPAGLSEATIRLYEKHGVAIPENLQVNTYKKLQTAVKHVPSCWFVNSYSGKRFKKPSALGVVRFPWDKQE